MTAAQKRASAVKLAKSRAKKNAYTQGGNRVYFWGKPEGKDPGHSDCSAAVRAVLLRAAGIDIGYNTSAQIQNRSMGILVEDNRSGARTFPTPSKLLPGDCIYYKGTSSHAWGVGHVEMAISKTQCIGHGSGMGPTVKTIKSYSKGRTGSRGYLCVIRWIKDDADTPAPEPVEETAPPEDTAGKMLVDCTLMNVRSGPGTDYEIVKVVKKGDLLTPVDVPEGWLPVLVGKVVRWVSQKYLKRL